MACTSAFVGTPASLRAPAATRSARARVSVRADASSASTCVVTPATVGSRSGSASVKGTVRKQNEDRFASYVSIPPPPFRETSTGLRARGRRDAAGVARRRRPIRSRSAFPTIRDVSVASFPRTGGVSPPRHTLSLLSLSEPTAFPDHTPLRERKTKHARSTRPPLPARPTPSTACTTATAGSPSPSGSSRIWRPRSSRSGPRRTSASRPSAPVSYTHLTLPTILLV